MTNIKLTRNDANGILSAVESVVSRFIPGAKLSFKEELFDLEEQLNPDDPLYVMFNMEICMNIPKIDKQDQTVSLAQMYRRIKIDTGFDKFNIFRDEARYACIEYFLRSGKWPSAASEEEMRLKLSMIDPDSYKKTCLNYLKRFYLADEFYI